jgi:hypothetical protein
MYLMLKGNHTIFTFTGALYLVSSSLLGTLGYNLFRSQKPSDSGNSSLLYYKKGEFNIFSLYYHQIFPLKFLVLHIILI